MAIELATADPTKDQELLLLGFGLPRVERPLFMRYFSWVLGYLVGPARFHLEVAWLVG